MWLDLILLSLLAALCVAFAVRRVSKSASGNGLTTNTARVNALIEGTEHARAPASTAVPCAAVKPGEKEKSGCDCECGGESGSGGSCCQAPPRPPARKVPSFTILYGTQSGTSESYAKQLSQKLEATGKFDVTLMDLANYEPEALAQEEYLALIVATYTDGTPTPSAKDFYWWVTDEALSERSWNMLRNVKYTVFGLGNSLYGKNYNTVGRTLDKCLRQLGATRFYMKGEGDESNNQSGKFDKWEVGLFNSLVRQKLLPDTATTTAKQKGKKPVSNNSGKKAAESAPTVKHEQTANADSSDSEDDEEPLADIEDLGAGLASSSKPHRNRADRGIDGSDKGVGVAVEDDEDEGGDNDADEEEEEEETEEPAGREMLSEGQKTVLTKQGYRVIGSHSGVKMCRWTKAMLRGRGGCYKHTFYGIASHRCMETTPSMACANKCVFCIAEGTLVSTAPGMALPIEQLEILEGCEVLALDKDGTVVRPQRLTAFTESGIKECVELTFYDGRMLVCTPDHRIRVAATATAPAHWVPAGELAIGTAVAASVEFARGSVGNCEPVEQDWYLDLSASLGRKLSVATPDAALQAFAFARLVGWFVGNGLRSTECNVVCHELDVQTCSVDIALLTGTAPHIALSGASGFQLSLPLALVSAVESVGCPLGTRNDCVSLLPAFVCASECPISIVREFLGGLFGSTGLTPHLSYEHKGKPRFTDVGLLTVCKGHCVGKQKHVLQGQLLSLLARCGVDVANCTVKESPQEDQQTACRASTDGSIHEDVMYNVTLHLGIGATVPFADFVGFRYCCHKQVQLSAAAAYHRTQAFIRTQQQWLSAKATELEASGNLQATASLAKELLSAHQPLHPVLTMWSPEDHTQSVALNQLVEELAIDKLFSAMQNRQSGYVEHDPDEDDMDEKSTFKPADTNTAWPTFPLKLIGRRNVGLKRVFDLTVPLAESQEGSFVANGVIVHNCWRHHKNPVGREWRWVMDDPETIFRGAVDNHVAMIKQLKGVPGVRPERFEEAFTVKHCALSLVGEPILYPRINEFVDLLHKSNISSFLVTNAQFPDRIEQLKPVTQLYISVDAATPESLKIIDRPLFPDYWERFLASIDALAKKGQRTVFRLTLVKGWNMEEVENYAQLMKRGHPDFIEIKGVTYCGGKRPQIGMKNVPWHEEVVRFAQEIANKLDGAYELASEHAHSCCVLLANVSKFKRDGKWYTWIDFDKFIELVKEGRTDFTSVDYMQETPAWAVFGASERGFDPGESRDKKPRKAGC